MVGASGTMPRSAGAALRAYRRRAGLTQSEAARLAALSIGAVRDIEQGRVAAPRVATLRRLGVALGMSDAELAELASGRPAVANTTGQLWIGILGPLLVRVGGEEIDPGSHVQRTLLGMLALAPNATVTRQRLLARVAAAGRHATEGGLAARMSRLRRRLRAPGGAGAPLVVASPGGYTLAVAEEQLDLLSFLAQVRQGRRYAAVGDLPQAWHRYAQAVRLWRGEPLSGLAALADDPAVVRLVRQWPAVAAEFATVGIELGRYDEVVPVLRQVVAADPLHETIHARLVVALAGAGRQAEALAVFDALRRRLDRDLGTAPGPELVEAHRRVLRQEVIVLPVARVRAYRTLPPDLSGFAGRRPALAWLWAQTPSDEDSDSNPTVLVIEGAAGVGKTRLALRYAHQLVAEGRYSRQQWYADLGGGGGRTAADPATVLGGFLRLWGAADQGEVETLAQRYQERLDGVPSLVLLDDAASAAQVAPLLPAGRQHLCVVTTQRPVDLPGARRLRLEAFTPQEGVEVLAAILGPDRVGAEPETAARLVAGCGGWPLAVVRLAQRLQSRPGWRLADLEVRLAEGEGDRYLFHGFEGDHPRLDRRESGRRQ